MVTVASIYLFFACDVLLKTLVSYKNSINVCLINSRLKVFYCFKFKFFFLNLHDLAGALNVYYVLHNIYKIFMKVKKVFWLKTQQEKMIFKFFFFEAVVNGVN